MATKAHFKRVPRTRAVKKAAMSNALRQARYGPYPAASILRGDPHHKEFTVNSLQVIQSPTQRFNLSDIAQGTNQAQRLGHKLQPLSIYLKGRLHSSVGNIHTNDQIRVTIIQDLSSNLTSADYDTIFNGTDPISLKNLDQSPRFRILADKLYNMGFISTNSNITNGTTVRNFNIWVSGKKMAPVQFREGFPQGDEGNTRHGTIWLFIQGRHLLTPHVVFDARIRTKFIS